MTQQKPLGEPVSCQQCGKTHVTKIGLPCQAHRRDGEPCPQPAMRDQNVCRKHGGKAPQALAAVERRREHRKALLAVETLGLPREVDPHTALLEELYRTVGAVEWLGAVVADLERGEVVWGKTEKVKKGAAQFPGTDVTHAAAVNVWVQLWQSERDRLVKVAKACIDAGIEERRVRLAESQGAMLAGVIRGVLDAMFAALVEALGSYDAAVDVLRGQWPVLVGQIVPAQMRAVLVEEATS